MFLPTKDPCPSLPFVSLGSEGYRPDKRGPATLLRSWTSSGYLIMTYTLRSFSSLAEVGSRPSGGQEHEVGLAPIRSPLFPTAPYWLWANAWVCECRLVTRTPWAGSFSTFHELSTWHSTSFCAGIECFSVLLLLLFLYKFFTTSILSFRNIFFFFLRRLLS